MVAGVYSSFLVKKACDYQKSLDDCDFIPRQSCSFFRTPVTYKSGTAAVKEINIQPWQHPCNDPDSA